MLKNHKIVTFSLLIAGLISLSACETLSGAGRDLQKAGSALENAAD